jgi:hypothetical protein
MSIGIDDRILSPGLTAEDLVPRSCWAGSTTGEPYHFGASSLRHVPLIRSVELQEPGRVPLDHARFCCGANSDVVENISCLMSLICL